MNSRKTLCRDLLPMLLSLPRRFHRCSGEPEVYAGFGFLSVVSSTIYCPRTSCRHERVPATVAAGTGASSSIPQGIKNKV